MSDMLVQTALRNLPQYLSKSAMLCFETFCDALNKQPGSSAQGEGWKHLLSGDLDVFGSQFPKTAERIRQAIYATPPPAPTTEQTDFTNFVDGLRAAHILHELDAPPTDHKTVWMRVSHEDETVAVNFYFDPSGKFNDVDITV
jgi:hypothetical protein